MTHSALERLLLRKSRLNLPDLERWPPCQPVLSSVNTIVFRVCFAALLLSSCASRPTEAVLRPLADTSGSAQTVTVVAVTNRVSNENGEGFGSTRATSVSYERYEFSVPLHRNDTRIYYPTEKRDFRREYLITKRDALTRGQLLNAVTHANGFDGTVAIFVHGFNNSYQEALFRTAQLAADVNSATVPILFSWPSAASLTGYVADRDGALSSRSDLDDVIKAAAGSAKVRRVILFGHSMGGFLSMEAVRQLKLQGDLKVLAKLQVILASPDIDVDVFRSQMSDIGKLPTPITLLVSKSDRALIASSFLAGQRQRVGKVDVKDPVVVEAARREQLRVVDISALTSVDGLGHDRFATFAGFAGRLIENEARGGKSLGRVGAYVLDAAGDAVSSPFRLVGEIVGR